MLPKKSSHEALTGKALAFHIRTNLAKLMPVLSILLYLIGTTDVMNYNFLPGFRNFQNIFHNLFST